MAIITLTTDLGITDSYVAAVKGAILKELPQTNIIDITHQVPLFDILKTAFVLKSCYTDFPDGTIHIIGVNSEATLTHPHVVVYYKNQYFIGADNGVFSIIFDTLPDKVVELSISQDTDIITFPTKDVFVKAACHIARGGTIEVLGKTTNTLLKRETYRPFSEETTRLKGAATYIDHYGNIITNITKQLFYDFGKGRNFNISFRKAEYAINTISNGYNAVPDGERVALFSSTGFLEISINKGSASNLLGITVGDIIRIDFDD